MFRSTSRVCPELRKDLIAIKEILKRIVIKEAKYMTIREQLADAYMKEEARNGEIMDVWQRERSKKCISLLLTDIYIPDWEWKKENKRERPQSLAALLVVSSHDIVECKQIIKPNIFLIDTGMQF